MDDLEKDLARMLREFMRQFKGYQPGSFSFSYGYSTGAGEPSSESSSENLASNSKKYQFKDFNIRYYFDPKNSEQCYLNMTNVPEKDIIRKVYIDYDLKKDHRIKVYIDCTNYFIVDNIQVERPCTLQSYSLEKSSNSKILILKLRF